MSQEKKGIIIDKFSHFDLNKNEGDEFIEQIVNEGGLLLPTAGRRALGSVSWGIRYCRLGKKISNLEKMRDPYRLNFFRNEVIVIVKANP